MADQLASFLAFFSRDGGSGRLSYRPFSTIYTAMELLGPGESIAEPRPEV